MSGSHPLIILFAPDSFKGSITSVEVARALAQGWRTARPDDTLLLSPLADGGEGTVAAIDAAGGWRRASTTVRDPLGRRRRAQWLLSDDGSSAVVEMAEASGLSLVEPLERDAVAASSIGTGELLRAAIDAGATRIVLGIGGAPRPMADGGSSTRSAVQEERARVGQLEAPAPLLDGACECAALVAEEPSDSSNVSARALVDLDERPRGAQALAVDCPRHELFAGPTLSDQEHGRGRGGDLLNALKDGLYLRALAHDVAEALFDLLAEIRVLGIQSAVLVARGPHLERLGTLSRNSSESSGLVTKSQAPSRMASTAMSIVP